MYRVLECFKFKLLVYQSNAVNVVCRLLLLLLHPFNVFCAYPQNHSCQHCTRNNNQHHQPVIPMLIAFLHASHPLSLLQG